MALYRDESPPSYRSSPDERTPLCSSRSRSPRSQRLRPPSPYRSTYHHYTSRLTISHYIVGILAFGLLITTIALILVVTLPSSTPHSPKPPQGPPVKIAIIGAGPAGVAAAVQLSNELNPYGRVLELVVFEQTALIGGRMAIDVKLGNFAQPRARSGDIATSDVFAAGGVLRSRAETYLGMKFDDKWKGEVKNEEIAFFDGHNVITRVTRPYKEMDSRLSRSLSSKYGYSVNWAKGLSSRAMKTFQKLVNPKQGVEGVMEMVEAGDAQEEVSTNAMEMLKSSKVSDSYRKDVVEQEVRHQLGQGIVEVSALALNMALMAEDKGSRIDGKLEDVLAGLLKKSKAEIRMMTETTDIRLANTSGWIVESKHARDNQKTEEVFDKVILAGYRNTTADDYFRPLYITFIITDGALDTRYFHVQQNGIPSQFLIVDNQRLPQELKGVREISYIKDLYGPDLSAQAVHKLYRVISDRPIPENLISKIGGNGILRILGLESRGYPLLFPRSEGFKKFKVEYGLYQTSVIEEIGSSVDLSWAAGENVARLIKKEIEEEGKV
ncbi:hypothetical protein F5884DRAFT_795595 [Xylogone sp. PMI_703]|nr:hypothetical protein F5884DRAFT_795595 [Xylogone sp. PMI_703]